MEQEKRKYWHNFDDCYDVHQLAAHGIEVIREEHGGDVDFEYNGVTIAFALDTANYPVQFAMSYRLSPRNIEHVWPGTEFDPGSQVYAKFGSGMEYWRENTGGPYEHLPRKFREPPLYWVDTEMPLEEFRKEFNRRLMRSARLYARKIRELGLKFEIAKKQRLRKYSDEECIENFVSKELSRHDPVIELPNGHRLVMFYAKNLAFAINEGKSKEERVTYVLKLNPVDWEGHMVEKFGYHDFWIFDMAVRGILDIPGETKDENIL